MLRVWLYGFHSAIFDNYYILILRLWSYVFYKAIIVIIFIIKAKVKSMHDFVSLSDNTIFVNYYILIFILMLTVCTFLTALYLLYVNIHSNVKSVYFFSLFGSDIFVNYYVVIFMPCTIFSVN